jgi:uncharacterized protein (DUF2141 family)
MRTLILALALASFVALVAVAGAANGKDVVESTCDDCHSYDRICRNLGKPEGFWKMTTDRMIVNGAPMSKAEADSAAVYLAGLAPGSKTVCDD